MGLFTRTFSHKKWVDAVDRVTAGGDNGFNVRFQALEVDLDNIAAAFDTVASGLERQATINLVPGLTQSGTNGWVHGLGTASKAPSKGDAAGLQPVALPARGTIKTFRVLGQNTGNGTLKIELIRQEFTTSSQVSVVTITAPKTTSSQVFDLPRAPVAGTEGLDQKYSYFVSATLSGADPADVVALYGFQLICLTS
ncbi:hypothetical protein NDR87_03275 [Nocardia sp. CDC159]|uniref:Uncharacterized protein n=1 Tax=Nocardia pulmonis TaxID=2951408 RepID=A0A9X2E172_9NOCA|nr:MULTISPECIES: hypothetical protein [Nocardia]MCM6771964.1 hypothetical protein [Nocardia pulmonis]MCM6785378.1 hypothetical protein [Nocardia sp. CDC159]